ncbi:MAG TPA: crossover junction endodeoxyribonuclease RuvC [Acidimicrobiales bacterium]|nr:crossover junction endodeoxyribonuclease RuvC [Acidimicrobiales bacterium]
MFVLGIDPGLSRCGYGCVEQVAGRQRAVAAGVVTTDRALPLPDRLATLRRDLRELVEEHAPDVVVVERVFFQTNVRTAMSVGQASGVALLTAAEAGCEVAEYSSNEVKLAVTGYGAATKKQVQRMVATLLALGEVPRPPDAADALALALCHLAASRTSRRLPAGEGRGHPTVGAGALSRAAAQVVAAQVATQVVAAQVVAAQAATQVVAGTRGAR